MTLGDHIRTGDIAGTPSSLCVITNLWEQPMPVGCSFAWANRLGEDHMTRSARIALAAALLVGGATIATAQNGPPTGGYPPATKNPNLYGYYGYHHRHYGYHHRYYAYHPRYHHRRHWYRY
jgi:hypothetical protein